MCGWKNSDLDHAFLRSLSPFSNVKLHMLVSWLTKLAIYQQPKDSEVNMFKQFILYSSVLIFFGFLVFSSVEYAHNDRDISFIAKKKPSSTKSSSRFGFTNAWVRR
jgi:hypothetical protein